MGTPSIEWRREQPVIGWDVGGAHLKAARVETDGCVSAVWLEPCPLWQGLEHLERALDRILGEIQADGPRQLRHAVTMTGEMTDLFRTREEGVSLLTEAICRRLGKANVLFYAGDLGWLDAEQARCHANAVASSNWHATAQLVAHRLEGSSLLLDVGSTTTDIIPIVDGKLATSSRSDSDRLAAGELVYTGVVRTPVMGIADQAPVAGRFVPLMAEHFATSADVYRILGMLPESADLHGTADGGEKNVEASRVRLARMVGRDAHELPAGAWSGLAHWLADVQMTRICRALHQVLSRSPGDAPRQLVVAGAGDFLGPLLAGRLDLPVLGFSNLVKTGDTHRLAGWCAPAIAVGSLLMESRLCA